MFGEIGIEKIFLLLVVVLLLFGAKRIPEIGASFGRGIREFKRSVNDLQNDAHSAGAAAMARRDAPPVTDPSAPTRVDDARSEPKRLLGSD